MTRHEHAPGERNGPGCLQVGLGTFALVLLAPWAALVRWWKSYRRGKEPRVEWGVDSTGELWSFDLTVDVTAVDELRSRTALIDTMVRIAETLRRPDDQYNLVFRAPWEAETRLIAVGPQPQELAQRLVMTLSHRSSERSTQIWLTLPRETRLGGIIDPFVFDPEAEGAPAALAAASRARWWAVTAFARTAPSIVYRVRLHVPGESGEAVRALVRRLADEIGSRRST